MRMKKGGKQKIMICFIAFILVATILPMSHLKVAADDYQPQEYPTTVALHNLTETWNITWSGNSSDATGPVPVITYCNASGINNETMNVVLTVNATQGIEWINVSIGNLRNTTNGWWHNASNVTLWISGDNVTWQILQDNAGYGMGVFPDCGANLTITDAIWGVFPGNPWTYHGDAGIILGNCSIFLRFQCNLTMGLNYGYYWNATSCKVHIGEYAVTLDSKNFSSQLQNGLEPMEGCCLDVNKTVWNGTDWDECVAFEEGTWNGVTSTQMQYWGHGRIENTSGYLNELQSSINVTKEANVSTISNLAVDNIVNYTITICNDGDIAITNITVNDTLPDNVEYVWASMPGVNITNPYGNYYIINVTNETQELAIGACESFNITVNFTAGCYPNGTLVTNEVTVTNAENANGSANVTVQYGTNEVPVITAHFPIFDRDGTALLLTGINITVSDDNGDTMNISFGTNKTTTWTNYWDYMGTNLTVANGTYNCNQTFNNTVRYNTKWRWGNTHYYWEVNVTDGKGWTNESFDFITTGHRQDVVTDGAVDVFDLSATWANRDALQTYLGIYDVNGDVAIDVFDLSNIWANKT